MKSDARSWKKEDEKKYITKEKVSLRKMKDNKAVGGDGIPRESVEVWGKRNEREWVRRCVKGYVEGRDG